MSYKSNYYTETVTTQSIFEYFKVSNNKFHHFLIITLKFPLNRNYDPWFNILKGQFFVFNNIIFYYKF